MEWLDLNLATSLDTRQRRLLAPHGMLYDKRIFLLLTEKLAGEDMKLRTEIEEYFKNNFLMIQCNWDRNIYNEQEIPLPHDLKIIGVKYSFDGAGLEIRVWSSEFSYQYLHYPFEVVKIQFIEKKVSEE